jgi:hypothetical protein
MADLNNITPMKGLPPFLQYFRTIGIIPSSYKVTMTYEEQVLELMRFIRDEIIPKINENVLATSELQEKFKELVTYIDEYFENLDIQEEVNVKLDEMAESGQLAEIIAQYVNTQCLLVFNTLNDMKNATNIINGSLIKICGYNYAGDGGEAIFKAKVMTNDVILDNCIFVALNDNTLYAELINKNNLKFENFGAYGDGLHDDTIAIQKCIEFCESYDNYKIVCEKNKNYKISDTLLITKNLNIDLSNSKIYTLTELPYLIKISNINRQGSIVNGNFDGLNITSAVIYVDFCANYIFDKNYIYNVKNNCIGLELTSSNEQRNFEFKATNLTIIGDINETNNTGIKVDTNDAIFDNIVIERCNTGILVNKSLGMLTNAHIWVFTGQYATSRGIVFNSYSEENLISNIIFDGLAKDIVCLNDCPVLSISNIHSYIGVDEYEENKKYFLFLNATSNNLPISLRGGIIRGRENTKLYACNYNVNLKCTNLCFSYSVNTNTIIAGTENELNQNSLINNISFNRYINRFNDIVTKNYEFSCNTTLNIDTPYKLVNETNLRLVNLNPRDYITRTNNNKRFLVRFDRDGGNFNIIPIDQIVAGDSFNVSVSFIDNIINFNPKWE